MNYYQAAGILTCWLKALAVHVASHLALLRCMLAYMV